MRQTCEAFDTVKSEVDDLKLHECRKQAKYFFQELQIIELLVPPSLKKLRDTFHELERQLGEDHDLAMLRREVMTWRKGGLATDTDRLITHIDDSRRELQRRALPQGTVRWRPFPQNRW